RALHGRDIGRRRLRRRVGAEPCEGAGEHRQVARLLAQERLELRARRALGPLAEGGRPREQHLISLAPEIISLPSRGDAAMPVRLWPMWVDFMRAPPARRRARPARARAPWRAS